MCITLYPSPIDNRYYKTVFSHFVVENYRNLKKGLNYAQRDLHWTEEPAY